MIERTAIILEIVAFFMVTTDLYGEIRLEALHEKLTGFSKKADDRVRKARSKVGRITQRLINIRTPAMLGFGLLALCCVGIEIHTRLLGPKLSVVSLFGVVILASLIANFEFATTSEINTSGMLTVLAAITATARWLLRKVKVSGLLLMFGTILFVIAKVLQFIATGHPPEK